MSPTSYQTAPPRALIITTWLVSVKPAWALIQPTDILPLLGWSVMTIRRGKERACGFD